MDLSMRRAAVLTAACMPALLGACSHALFDSEIRAIVRTRLGAEQSVEFGRTLVSERYKGLACVEFTAGKGGNQGFLTALLIRTSVSKTERPWKVEAMNLKFDCTEDGLHKYVGALRSLIRILDKK